MTFGGATVHAVFHLPRHSTNRNKPTYLNVLDVQRQEDVKMKHTLLLLFFLGFGTHASSEAIIFLERGGRGIVPCPLITSGRFTLEDADAVYWYYGQKDRGSLLISYFRGTVAPQNMIPHGVYDINGDFSMVIERVGPADEGIYFCQVKPKLMWDETEHVIVQEKVSPNQPFPAVSGCKPSLNPRQCEVEIRDDSLTDNLTCSVDSVKPAVELRWFRVLANGSEERVAASQAVTPVILPPNQGTALRNNTFSTSASMKLTSVHDDVTYRCEAFGVAVGSGSHMTVSLAKAPSTLVNYSSAQPCPTGNTGTVPALTNESSVKTAISLGVTTVISLGVTIGVLLGVIVIMTSVYLVSRQRRRHRDKKHAEEMELGNYKPLPTTNGTC